MLASDYANYPISHEDVRRARRAYFANISYVDEKIGEILDVLKRTRQEENTIVVFLSDHGDMLGERGMWFKMSFFEGSARVPLMIAAPGPDLDPPGRIDTPVSTLDVVPTLAELAGIDLGDISPWTDGESLVGVAAGTAKRGPVPMEYAAEGSVAPMVALARRPFQAGALRSRRAAALRSRKRPARVEEPRRRSGSRRCARQP